MREEQVLVQDHRHPMPWTDASEEMLTHRYHLGCQLVLEAVDARAGGASTRRVFRGRLVNHGETTVAATLDVTLPAPFLPSAPILLQQVFVLEPAQALRVELGSTVGIEPCADKVRGAVRVTLRPG